jgi:hypothetical protein
LDLYELVALLFVRDVVERGLDGSGGEMRDGMYEWTIGDYSVRCEGGVGGEQLSGGMFGDDRNHGLIRCMSVESLVRVSPILCHMGKDRSSGRSCSEEL